jgi:hypothetical protein
MPGKDVRINFLNPQYVDCGRTSRETQTISYKKRDGSGSKLSTHISDNQKQVDYLTRRLEPSLRIKASQLEFYTLLVHPYRNLKIYIAFTVYQIRLQLPISCSYIHAHMMNKQVTTPTLEY